MNALKLLTASLIIFAAGERLNAATVILSLYPNQDLNGAPASGQFRITAKVLGGDSAGLSGYGADLTGNILDIDHRSPRDPSVQVGNQEGPAGFTLGRSPDNVVPPYILGSQDISNPDAILVYGFGQQNVFFPPGSFNPELVRAEMLVATGHFTGPIGWNQNGPNRGANVFNNNTGPAVRLPEELLLVVAPEPATATLVGLSLFAITAIRRRAA